MHNEIPCQQPQHLQIVAVQIPVHKEQLLIGSVYAPPSRPLTNQDLDTITTISPNFLLGGDFNSKHTNWNCRLTNVRGKILMEHSDKFNYNVFGPQSPTHFPSVQNHQPDVLDIFLLKTAKNLMYIETLNDLSSDHNPVIGILDIKPTELHHNHLYLRHTNWQLYRNFLKENVPGNITITSTQDIETSCNIITNTIKQAYISSQIRQKQIKTPEDFPELQELLRRKRKAKRLKNKFHRQADIQQYNFLKNYIHKRLQDIKIKHFEDAVSQAKQENKIWTISKQLAPKNAIRNTPIITSTGPVYNPEEKAEAIAKVYEAQFTPNPEVRELRQHYENVQREMQHILQYRSVREVPFVTPMEIYKILKQSPCNRAPGPDGIPYAALKNLPRNVITFITKLFNSIIKFEYFPKCWTKAYIISFAKPGKDSRYPHNRRPISLLNTMSKLFEKIILCRIKQIILNVIPDTQFGFIPERNTTLQLLRVTEEITKAFQHRYYTTMLLLDVEKAYDTVWHPGLIYKLYQAGIDPSLVRLITSFLTNRSFQVKYQNSFSSIKESKAGVPQGSILSPFLYNLYIADIPTSENIKIYQYADDTAFTSTSHTPDFSINKLQQYLPTLELWLQKWKIKLNVAKSQATIFTKCYSRPHTNITLLQTPIPWTSTVKYLGVTLDCRLTWLPHINTKIKKGYRRLHLLYPLIKSSALNYKVKVNIYKTLILSAIVYAAPAWAFIPKTTMKKLQVFQNKILRIIHGSGWDTRTVQLHDDLEINTVSTIIRNMTTKLYHKTSQNTNPLIYNLGTYSTATDKHRRPKSILTTIF